MLNNYEVKVMASADNDMQLIYNYIANELESADNANNTDGNIRPFGEMRVRVFQ